ncbi:ABC transporter ATP-binding protein [Agreia sp. COWG]|uniref:ABC transporter ATP-binding protein n=1 Tax=Agreia sp. COWG TaxID=2773266 RepID=UPI0019270DFB|nr:ABC transporter ATP-binding protein [Agreia sp. COWG]CAD6008387.1 Sulfate/thiosulfate import ATP-binding protein CysA [Agreia sp. COWG]
MSSPSTALTSKNHPAVDHPAVDLRGVEHRYGSSVSLHDVSLAVTDGEVLALVGPSGCGKSTLLRVIAGLLAPSAGVVHLAGDDATRLRAEKRGIGYVPQSYALFPHLDVRGNVAYGLAAQRVPRTERAARVKEALELTRLTEFADRMPSQLSGGQRQRVALARALAIRPTVLLLDEPLSALDPQLRDGMRRDLRALLDAARCTTIIVTHDQSEALALADRVAVMRAGRLVQLDTVEGIWQRPAEPFVAEFVAGAATVAARVADGFVELAHDWRVPLGELAGAGAGAGAVAGAGLAAGAGPDAAEPAVGEAFAVIRPLGGAVLSEVQPAGAETVPDERTRACVVTDAEPQGALWAIRVRPLTAGRPDPRLPEITVLSEAAWLPGHPLCLALTAPGTTVHALPASALPASALPAPALPASTDLQKANPS